jgi:hypothetical protein
MNKWFRAKPLEFQPVKTCSVCNGEKPLTEFSKHIHAKDDLDSRCKDCVKKHTRERNELRRFAPPKPDVCECCKKIPKKWCLDHDHETNLFRGWICDSCNTGIGLLGDTIEGVQKALDYLIMCKERSENNCVTSKYGDSMPYMTKSIAMKALRRNFTTI